MEAIENETSKLRISDEEKEIAYPILDKAGIRDWNLNYYFDLSVFKTRICDKLTGITLKHTDEYIYSIEFFYDNKSSGELKRKTSADSLHLITTHVPIKKDDFISSVKGSFNVDYITGIEFILHSGLSHGFQNKFIQTKTDIKFFMFKQQDSNGRVDEIISFKMAFGKYLTFISPIFRENLNLTKNGLNDTYATPCLGKFNNNLKHFSIKEKFADLGRLKRIGVFHDNVIVKGVELQYENEFKFRFHNYSNQDDFNKLRRDIIELDLADSEVINQIMIRSGDVIDNITMYTNRGKVISAGGHGGYPYIYHIDEITKLQAGNLRFVGIEGGYSGDSTNLQYIKLIFI